MRFLSSCLLPLRCYPTPITSVAFSNSVPRISKSFRLPVVDLEHERRRRLIDSVSGVVKVGTGGGLCCCFSTGGSFMAVVAAAAAATEEGSVARRLWIKSQREVIFATFTPFVVCLASGKLELESFRQYIVQDFHFLKCFAQAYEMAEEYADDDDDKVSINELRKGVLEELKMHNSVVEEWGIDPTKEIISSSATAKYTSFLLGTAAGKVDGGKGPGKIVTPFEKTKIAAYTVGAMTPCMRLYAFLGKEFGKLVNQDGNSHPYKNWIENYSSEKFAESAQQIEDLLDKLSISLTGEELEVIEKLYRQAMKLEMEFFLAQPIMQAAVVPLIRVCDHSSQLIVFSDFDLTCTVVDSSAILAEIAIRTAPKSDEIEADNPNMLMSASDLRTAWDALSRQYTEEHEQCIESILQREEATKFDYEGLHEALEHLSDFEQHANSRVIDSGVLKGMNLSDIKRAGERLILQDGCLSFFLKVLEKKATMDVDLHLLSFCWCADLIRSTFSSGSLSALNIHSNEFEFEDSISTGQIVRKMESPLNKVESLKSILDNRQEKKLSVYIGDSVGDLLCLLEADVGIVVGSSPSLRRVGKHFGISFVPLFTGLVEKQKQVNQEDTSVWKGLSGVLYTVSSWSEIQAFVVGEQ